MGEEIKANGYNRAFRYPFYSHPPILGNSECGLGGRMKRRWCLGKVERRENFLMVNVRKNSENLPEKK